MIQKQDIEVPIMKNVQKFLRKNRFIETDFKDPEQITMIKSIKPKNQ